MFAGRNIEHIRQIPEKLLDVTLQPLMFVLLFAYVFGGAIAVQGGNYREYLIGGILDPVARVRADRPGDLDRHRPHRRRDRPVPLAAGDAYGVPLGHYLAELAGMALSIVVLLGAGLVVGWRVHTDVFHVASALVLLLDVRVGDDLDRHVDRA